MSTGQAVHMNQGEGEASYARNSTLQSGEQNRMRPVIEEAVKCLIKSTKSDGKIAIADLGCSSGPKALALVSCAVDAIFQHYRADREQVPPELSVFLNDLPDNDFNVVAKSLVAFHESDQRIGLVTGGIVPGSFYKRLFARSSLHLIFASSSVHWLSRAPEDLRTNGIPMYDGDDDLRQARGPLVLEAYARQFKNDLNLFLNLRAQELVSAGQMVISVPGRCASDGTCHKNLAWDAVACVLNDMATREVIDREKLNSFYIPIHAPSDVELREIIEVEGSFKINKMVVHEPKSGMDKSSITPKMIALGGRAVFEPMLVQHFGKSDQIGEEFVRTMEQHLSTGRSEFPPPGLFLLCVSLTKMV
ncbi:hypothetical protein PR202_gb17258 [Eleusine coracana subsp. coracana]|uniref:Uncharacterized protein n=1 Tax=Eleusine coracana subsp. coracana TaxID=191504 RepID=A0AAV5F2N1_ELECO|nr:hypothetical protein QOZ80_6BG0468210 [Eleusine coracana subsp. coracana]GJN29066.1 hypothetical protein PR202_gb17258 [Eleusine coracana subsp. coracana]